MCALRWIVSHVAAVLAMDVLDGFLDDQWDGLLLYGLPLAIGAVQVAFLHATLRSLCVLWLPACIVGLFLSFLGIWWFLLMLGAGLGTAQAPLLSMSGFRRCWIWVAASGLGWFIGMILGSFVSQSLPDAMGDGRTHLTVLSAVTAIVYGASTAAALHVMTTLHRCPFKVAAHTLPCHPHHEPRQDLR